MVPAYLEQLDAIPMTPQDKADRKALPAPSSRRAGGPAGEHVAAATDTEQVLADALARTLGVDTVSVDSNFFDDLGANSLLLAKFSALVRKETALPSLSMREVYPQPHRAAAGRAARRRRAGREPRRPRPAPWCATAPPPTGCSAPRSCWPSSAPPTSARWLLITGLHLVVHRRRPRLEIVGRSVAVRRWPPSPAPACCRSWPSGC